MPSSGQTLSTFFFHDFQPFFPKPQTSSSQVSADQCELHFSGSAVTRGGSDSSYPWNTYTASVFILATVVVTPQDFKKYSSRDHHFSPNSFAHTY